MECLTPKDVTPKDDAELAALRQQAQKNIASLILIKGRRRIGKSRLIEYYTRFHEKHI